MKKILSILLALALMLGAAALAEGNVTIAVQGMNDFNDNIQSMIVYGDKLLLSSWDTLYTWDNTSRKLTLVEGYDKLQNVLTGDGETPGALELNDGEYVYLDGNLYAVGGKLYRMATISDEDGNSTNQLVELLIADDGALSLGEIIDLGDALCIVETYGDETYTYTRNLSNPCSFGSMLYALSYGEELELLESYIFIQKVRFMNFRVEYDVPEQVLSMKIGRFMLQPFVENCIIHGLHGLDYEGVIRIRIRQTTILQIDIWDNGRGMKTDALTVPRKEATKDSVGIQNVAERIRLHYGERYGVHVENNPDRGVHVHIELPVIKGEEER